MRGEIVANLHEDSSLVIPRHSFPRFLSVEGALNGSVNLSVASFLVSGNDLRVLARVELLSGALQTRRLSLSVDNDWN